MNQSGIVVRFERFPVYGEPVLLERRVNNKCAKIMGNINCCSIANGYTFSERRVCPGAKNSTVLGEKNRKKSYLKMPNKFSPCKEVRLY